MSVNIKIIDTFPEFLTWWESAQRQSVDEQVKSWAAEYMSSWPELLSLQIADYEAQGVDWHQIARERIFPHLGARLTEMDKARQGLLEWIEPVYERAQQALHFGSEAVFIIYVGIGCGAGWTTKYGGLPAILFGLENIAECGWSESPAVRGLIAHEIGHLAHFYWREQNGRAVGTGPWWQLYAEGFAQICESLILGMPSWHQAHGDKEWLEWCQSHISWLATTFLETVDNNAPVSRFFGSWYTLHGKSQTGYFLGYRAVKVLLEQIGLRKLALIENVETYLRPVLEQIADRA